MPWRGDYYLNGIPISHLSKQQIRKHIAYLDQESFLYSMTIEENIRLGNREASLDEIMAACKISGAHDFIMKLPQGYQTMLLPSGTNISGGQKQRIALARMFVSNKPILLIDEGTSNLDKDTEQIIMRAILSMKHVKTIIMITHRRYLLKEADQIFELKDKQLVPLLS